MGMKNNLNKTNATYDNLSLVMGESIFKHFSFSSQKALYEMAGTCKLTLKHGLKAIIRQPDIANSILKIKLDDPFYYGHTNAMNFTARLCNLFINLETIIFLDPDLSYDLIFMMPNLSVTVKKIMFADIIVEFPESYLRSRCEFVFKTNDSL